ncbi:MAG TPA: fused response regulator/phosphatase [Chthoniobacteraceae bacterium]|jgi:sigma-B regulation protein RsbU (phosphoserine phosphatase)|nr:fused response regulator/phosphatase [Chthoniobacteraceae bacterium]
MTRLLIVEDSPTQALLLQRVLAGHGFEVMVARHGREALALIESNPPSLVITDINMPEMDGYELCRRIKDDPAFQSIPVILLTSLSDPCDILRGLECGADSFVVKPYDEALLLSRIRSVLQNLALRHQGTPDGATEIYFAGRKYHLHPGRLHSLDLLLSTYETAVQKNLELSLAKAKLEQQASQLRATNEQMQEELAMARELQSGMLPRRFPVFPATARPEESALRFEYRYSTTAQLGGDFFDVFAVSESAAAVLICDVMGHGVRAALVTAILRGLLEEVKPLAHEPGSFLHQLNQGLHSILKQTGTPLFATAFYLVVDIARGELRFANAGHPAAYHLRRSLGRLELLATAKPSPALGIFPETKYESQSRPYAAGEMVMLFTDGLFEVEGSDGKLQTKEQLQAAVARRLHLPAAQLLDEVVAEVKAYAANADFEDDMCLVSVELDPWPVPSSHSPPAAGS